MRSTGNQRSVIVGIFVFLGVAILVVTILTLGAQKKAFESSITVKTFFGNVNGLQKGNNVWFSGVKVGTIKRVTLQQNGTVEVDMNVEEQSVKFIPGDSKAKLSSDGLIGNKIIEIYGGTAGKPPITDGVVLNNDKLVSTDEMMNTLSKNNDNLLAITNDFKVVSGRIAEGKGSLGKLLTEETMYNQLEATTNTLQKVSQNLDRLSMNVSSYTAKLNSKGSLANDLVTDTIVFSNLRSTISQLREVVQSSQTVMNNLQSTSSDLQTGVKNINNSLASQSTPIGLLLNDPQAATNLRVTLRNLASGTKKLDEDLEALQHNFLLRGFFRKKAKLEKEDSSEVNN